MQLETLDAMSWRLTYTKMRIVHTLSSILSLDSQKLDDFRDQNVSKQQSQLKHLLRKVDYFKTIRDECVVNKLFYIYRYTHTCKHKTHITDIYIYIHTTRDIDIRTPTHGNAHVYVSN